MKSITLGITSCLIIGFSAPTIATDVYKMSGNISVQQRSFLDDPVDPQQHNHYSSIALEPEFYTSWNENQQSITFKPFYRHDNHDDNRTHGDVRELSWLSVYDDWELTIGISKIYWGVTETQHLVDVINQTDLVENIDGEDKLGQPMLRFSTVQDWGIIDFFILPGFRERTFPDNDGRPRILIPVNSDSSLYESEDKDHHVDYAMRWLTLFDQWELGISHFSGTNRDPKFVPTGPTFTPFYDLVNQTGIDMQVLINNWTWKLEYITKKDSIERFNAYTAGFEYTLYAIFDSDADLGVVIEYLNDDRGLQATSPFQNDITTALRLTLNDIQSSELLLGITTDLDDQIIATFLEASRRFGDSIKINLEARTFSNTIPTRPLHFFRQDDHIQIEAAWYF